MMHSILITHRNRHPYLYLCLWSIARSAEHCGVDDYEVVVVDNGSEDPPHCRDCPRVRWVYDDSDMPVFNKSRLFNRAIEEARGDVLTFLDCDALVGAEWMRGVEVLQDPGITRLCYRVRRVPKLWGDVVRLTEPREVQLLGARYRRRTVYLLGSVPDSLPPIVTALFRQYDRFPLAWEAWRHHDRNRYEPDYQVWGNSQFSMTREALGDLRYDERFEGKGFEDIDFLRQIEERYGDDYRGHMDMRPERNLLHLTHDYNEDDWGSNDFQVKNCDLYKANRGEPVQW